MEGDYVYAKRKKGKSHRRKKADVIVTEEVNENVSAEAVETEEVKEETAEAEVSVQEEESAPKREAENLILQKLSQRKLQRREAESLRLRRQR